jgi:hypothetical protein
MTENHPTTPSPELIEQWMQDHATRYDLARHAAQWGADQELEACCEWIPKATPWDAEQLRAARRPKPPSLKEQALEELENMVKAAKDFGFGGTDPTAIRRVLEQLDD